MTAHLAWAGGGEARLLLVDGERVALESTRPFPPGARVEGVTSAGQTAVRVKVHGSKALAGGGYRVDGRLVDATREARQELASLVTGPP